MSLRTRLTAWYLFVLTGMILVFGMAVYSLLSISMIRQIDVTLQRTARNMAVASVLEVRGIPLSLIQLELDLTANVYVQVVDPENNLIRQSQNLMGMQRPMDPSAIPQTSPYFSIVEDGTSRLRILTIPVISEEDGTIIAYYQLGSSLNAVDHAQATLVTVLAVGGSGALLLGALVTWIATGSALSPLREATESAGEITRSGDLSLRIETGSTLGDEIGRLVLAFNKTLDRLEKLFSSQSQFMADISHELRTPLTSVMGNLAYMQRVNHIDASALAASIKETERMSRLVQDLLFLNRAEVGEFTVNKDLVELDTLILEVFHQAKTLADNRVIIVLGEEDQARVDGDRDRLKQLFLNLVVNAVEFSPDGGQVSIDLRCIGEFVEIQIADTGEGIPPESIPHIFDRFYRSDPSRTRRKLGGAGLGLSIADSIVKAHNGRITVESSPGEGSKFTVTLPAASEGMNQKDQACRE